MQSTTLAHATTYTDQPHEHEGISCVIVTVATQAELVLPSGSTVSTVIKTVESTEFTPPKSYQLSLPQGRAPPPRGPPLTF